MKQTQRRDRRLQKERGLKEGDVVTLHAPHGDVEQRVKGLEKLEGGAEREQREGLEAA